MLMPRKVKHRKQQRGRMTGQAKGGSEVTFGDFGIQALEPGWLTARQIGEAFAFSRQLASRYLKEARAKWPDLDTSHVDEGHHDEADGSGDDPETMSSVD